MTMYFFLLANGNGTISKTGNNSNQNETVDKIGIVNNY